MKMAPPLLAIAFVLCLGAAATEPTPGKPTGDSIQAAATPTEVPPIPTPDAYRKDLENTFSCRTDDDCVAIRNGCGVRKIVGNSPDIHDRFRCTCKHGRVVRGCFRAEKGPAVVPNPPQGEGEPNQ